MKYLYTVIFTFSLLSPCFSVIDHEKIVSQLRYARFCADSLHDSHQAIEGYNDLLIMLKQSNLDSLRLVAETERIQLLKKIGERTELLTSLGSAIELARANKDYTKLSYLLNLNGFLYTQVGFMNQALNALDDAHANALQIKDQDERNLNLGYHAAVCAHTTENSDLKIAYLTRAYRYFMAIKPTSAKYRNAQITGNSYYASAFMEDGDLDSAWHYLSLSTSFIDPNNTLPDDHYAIFNFAKLHYLSEDYPKAKKWLEYGLSLAKRENNEYRQGIIYYHLYNTEFAMGKSQQANQYLQRYASLKEGLDKTQIKIISLVEDELTHDRQKVIDNDSLQETGIVSIFMIIAFLLCVSIVWLFVKKENNNQTVNFDTQDTLMLTDNEAHPEDNDTLLSDGAVLKKDTPSVKPNVPDGESYNEPKEVSIDKIKELNQLVRTNDPSFMVKFHEAFPGFAKTLGTYAYPALNNSEIEICACTKLNFSTKEIALYRNYTLRSVENRKYRIRKKLTLGSEVDFVVWIAGIN